MKSDERTGVLLSGYFGCGNLGDDLLLTVLVIELRAIMPGERFFVADHGDVASFQSLGSDVVFTGLQKVLSDRRRSRIMRAARYFADLIRLLRRCHWLIFGGGTIFHARRTPTPLLLQYGVCCLARLMRVRIAALGVGVSDLQTVLTRRLMRSIVAMSDVFLVRDEAALRLCAGTHARLTADLVFGWRGLASRAPSVDTCASSGSTVALTVCPPAFPNGAEEQAVAAFSNAVRVWHAHGHRVVFLVFLRSGVTPCDQAMFAQIAERLGPDIPVEVRVLVAEPAQIAAAYQDINVLCGMRFHGLVLAALFGIPFVGLAHENKISEICRRFDMSWLDASEFDGAVFAATVETALQRRPDRKQVERCISDARQNFRALADVVR